MANVVVSPLPVLQFVDKSGVPLVGGLLFVYSGGTTTKATTYSDASGKTPNTNPIVLNLFGSPPGGVFVSPATNLKFVLSPAGDSDPPSNPIWTIDNVSAPAIAVGTMASQNANAVNVSGGSISVGTLACTGATTVSTLSASGNVDLDGNVLTVTGASTFSGAATFSGVVTINNAVSINSNSLSLESNSGNAFFQIQSFAAGFTASMLLQSGASTRWEIRKDAVAESGSNTGSNLSINAYADSGALNFTALKITRSSGLVTIGSVLITAGGGLTLSGQTSGPGASTGTLTNAPHAANPGFWLPVTINGGAYLIPCWAA